jgi:hypothetical protein
LNSIARGGMLPLSMEITLTQLDDRGSDRVELVEFLTVQEFPFHATRRPTRPVENGPALASVAYSILRGDWQTGRGLG